MARKSRSMKRGRFSYEGGRQIYKDNEPFISVGREGKTMPVDADEVCHTIVNCLNSGKYKTWSETTGKRIAKKYAK